MRSGPVRWGRFGSRRANRWRPGAWLPEAGIALPLLLVLLVPDPLRRAAVVLFLACLLAWASWRGGTDSRAPGDWTRPGGR
jgi:hypothetical protein